MFPNPLSPLLRAWYKWKMRRLPWRRKFLVGLDLNGNTYWEFLDRGSRLPASSPSSTATARWRRIVRFPRSTHRADVAVPPAWHQWLRHARADAPTLAEQRADVARRERIRVLAAEADARWAAKPRLLVQDTPPSSPAGTAAAVLLGVREPAFDTERRVGPGSKVKAKAGDGGGGGGAGGEGTVGETGTEAAYEVALGDNAAVDQREETWKRTLEEAEAMKREREREKGRGKAAAAAPDPWKQQARPKK